MSRYVVIGSSGSGKTTTAAVLADRLGLDHVELDALYHQPDWAEPEPGAFEADVLEALGEDNWVVDGNYSRVRDVVWPRATTIVWLDYPRSTVMRQLVPRTLRRIATRQELWNGNREGWRNLFDTRPEENVIVWSWTRHDLQRDRYLEAQDDPQWAHLEWVVHRSPAETEAWLTSL